MVDTIKRVVTKDASGKVISVKNVSVSSKSAVQGPVRPSTDESTFRKTGVSRKSSSSSKPAAEVQKQTTEQPQAPVQGPVRPTTDERTFRETGASRRSSQVLLRPDSVQGTVQGPVRPSTDEATFRATGVPEQSVVPRQQERIKREIAERTPEFGVSEGAAFALGGLAAGSVAAAAGGAAAVKGAATLAGAFLAPKAGEALASKQLTQSQQEFLKSDIGVGAFRAGAGRRDVVVSEKGSFTRLVSEGAKLSPSGVGREIKGLAVEGVQKLSTAGERDAFLKGAADFARSKGQPLTREQTQALVVARAGRAGGEIAGIGLGGASAELIGAKGIAKGFAQSTGRQFTKQETVKLTIGQTVKPLIKAGAVEGAAVELAGTSARKQEFSPVRTAVAAGTGALSAATLGVALVKAQAVGRRTGRLGSTAANIADPTEIATDVIAGVGRGITKKVGGKVTPVPVITAGTPGKFTFGAETVSPPKAKARTTTKIRAAKTRTDSGLVLKRTKVATVARPSSETQPTSLPTQPSPKQETSPFVDPRADVKPTVDPRADVPVQPFVDPRADVKPAPFVNVRTDTRAAVKTQIKPFTSDIILPPKLKVGGGGSGFGTGRLGRGSSVVGSAPSLTQIFRGTAKERKKRGL